MIASHHSSFIPSVASVTAVPGNRRNLYSIVCVVNMLALCTGIPISYTSPLLSTLLSEDHLHENPLRRVITKQEASIIGSLLTVGGFLGTYLAGISARKIGRRKSLIISCAVPFIIAFSILGHARTISLIYIARLLSGVAVSGVYTVIPLYNGEIAENSNRGLICCSMITFQATGQLFAFSIGPFISIFNFCIISVGIALIAASLIVAVIPESPYYLIGVNDRRNAEKALIKLRSTVGREITNELNLIQVVVEEYKEQQGTILDIFRSKPLRKAHITSVGLIVFQSWSGIVVIYFYPELIFEHASNEIPPEICAMSVGIIAFISSFLTPGLVDWFGRRSMLFVSATGMCISLFLLGLYFYLKEKGHDITYLFWLPILCVVAYLIFYMMGYGPLVWTVMAEIFPINLRSAAATLTVAWSWASAFVVSLFFQPVADIIGMSGCFWFFAGSNALAAIFSVTFLIETRGRSFQEIQGLLT